MNIEMILPLLKKWFPAQKINEFQQGFELLKKYKQTHNVNSAKEALNALMELNVPIDFLSQTGGLAKNPVVSSIAHACNVDADKIQQDVQTLMGSRTIANDSLESFKNDLNKLK